MCRHCDDRQVGSNLLPFRSALSVHTVLTFSTLWIASLRSQRRKKDRHREPALAGVAISCRFAPPCPFIPSLRFPLSGLLRFARKDDFVYVSPARVVPALRSQRRKKIVIARSDSDKAIQRAGIPYTGGNQSARRVDWTASSRCSSQ